MRALKYSLLLLLMGFICSCKQPSQEQSINTQTEIERWKSELIHQKGLGNPCQFKSLDDPAAEKWRSANSDQNNGWPSDGKNIHSVTADFDADQKPDLLLFFQSENCSGHNGGTPAFAKIIYANGKSNGQLMNQIRKSILEAYQIKLRQDSKLKPVTADYLEGTTTISYSGRINGTFTLYSATDAHCCPSYTGKYQYDLKNQKAEIAILATY